MEKRLSLYKMNRRRDSMNRTEIMQKADDVIKDQKLREMFKKCLCQL